MVEVAVANKHVTHGFEWDASGLKAIELLRSFGWTDIIDLGDITTARGTEMLLPILLRLFGALQKPVFNFKIVR